MEGASESCLFTLNVCVACVRVLCFALRKIQRKGGRVVKGASLKTLVRVYVFLVGRSINDPENQV
jgi:hypothetical protein